MIRTVNVVINGAAGNIAYALLPLICNGLIFGKNIKINLHLLDLPKQVKKLRGTILELKDGSYPCINKIHMDFDAITALRQAHICIFMGGVPPKKSNNRVDLFKKNLKIYKEIGRYLNRYASENCKVLSVVIPVNTLATVMTKNCSRINPKNFTALSRLDYNRARNILSEKCKTRVEKIKDLIVWGNHSDKRYADTSKVKVDGVPIGKLVEEKWLRNEFENQLRGRWKEIINTRGNTSVMSPANAIKDHIKDWFFGIEDNSISMGVISDGEHFGVPKGMCFSMPVKPNNFDYNFVDYNIDKYTQERIHDNVVEIQNELDAVGFKL